MKASYQLQDYLSRITYLIIFKCDVFADLSAVFTDGESEFCTSDSSGNASWGNESPCCVSRSKMAMTEAVAIKT